MALYILDTDHLAYLQRGEPTVLSRLEQLGPDDRVLTSVVGVGELLKGVLVLPPSKRQKQLLQLYREVVAQLPEALPITRSVAERFGVIDADLRRKGKPIPTNDVWVAAVAMDAGGILVSNDKHFREIESLSRANWML